MGSYWSRTVEQRISRRRAMIASSGALTGAALLAACGGSDDKGGAVKDTSGLLTSYVDTSKEAKRGGILKNYAAADITSFEPHITQSGGQGIFNECYSLFVRVKPGIAEPTKYEIQGDMAESWEWSPDGLTLTMKLRQGAGWAPLPPVNGRPVTIEDIAYTWKRFGEVGQNRSDYFNALNPYAPVLSMTTPDPRTFVFNLKFPQVGLVAMLAATFKQAYIVPKEADSAFDVRNNPVSSGQFYVANYQPSIGFSLKRNPNYFDKERPYLDGVDRPIVSEYGVGLAQFRTGAIHYFQVNADDVLTTKKDVPQLAMYAADIASPVNQLGGAAGARLPYIFFGWKPSPPEKAPFRDERVRQAFSMSLDREAWTELKGNVSKFEAEGLPVITRWNSALDLDLDGWWMDPRDKDFGPNAKYYMHDLAEAKKLLAAAGFPNGVEVASNWPPTGYGLTLGKDVEVHEGMAREAGFSFVTNNPAFNTEWAPKFRDSRGNYEGLSYRGLSISAPDAIERLAGEFLATPGLLTFSGFDVNGKGDFSGDPTLEEMILKGRKETDTEQRRSLVKEIQRYAAKRLYNLHPLGAANGFDLAWPAVKNYNVFRGEQRVFLHNWLDQNEAPFKS